MGNRQEKGIYERAFLEVHNTRDRDREGLVTGGEMELPQGRIH